MGENIVIRVCPECEKAFYAGVSPAPLSCAFCACFFEDKRRSRRTRKETGLTFWFMDGAVPPGSHTRKRTGCSTLAMLKAGSVVVEIG